MGIDKRIERLARQAGADAEKLQINASIVRYSGGRDPTEAEEKAAIEAYWQEHGGGPLVILAWDGEKFVDN